jgi:response regulator RpfG family c-di-GMP phosphodiesterase
MTGYSDRTDEERILSLGCHALISKPILRKELGAVIKKVLGKKVVKAK